MKRYLSIVSLVALCALSACESEKVEVLKSPCVGVEGSPCGPKRPVNGNYNQEAAVTAVLARHA